MKGKQHDGQKRIVQTGWLGGETEGQERGSSYP